MVVNGYTYPLVNKQLDPENHHFFVETSLPTPTTARVELLIYQRVMDINGDISWGYIHIYYPLVNVYVTMERSTMFFLDKSTISTGPFSNSYVTNYQRVIIKKVAVYLEQNFTSCGFFTTGSRWSKKKSSWDATLTHRKPCFQTMDHFMGAGILSDMSTLWWTYKKQWKMAQSKSWIFPLIAWVDLSIANVHQAGYLVPSVAGADLFLFARPGVCPERASFICRWMKPSGECNWKSKSTRPGKLYNITNWKDPPCWENPLFRLGHVQ